MTRAEMENIAELAAIKAIQRYDAQLCAHVEKKVAQGIQHHEETCPTAKAVNDQHQQRRGMIVLIAFFASLIGGLGTAAGAYAALLRLLE